MGEIIRRLLAGERAAQEEASNLLRGFARRICRGGGPPGATSMDWEDVAQEAMRRLYSTGLHQYRGEGTDRSYLYSIAKAAAIQMARSASRRRKREQAVAALSPAPAPGPERALDVRRVLAALDPACRELVERVFLQDDPYSLLAGELGLAESSVRARLSRCLRKAREIARRGRP